jgi:hypothetical protein
MVRETTETINDYNDRLVVLTAQHYKQATQDFGNVLLLTNDRENKVRLCRDQYALRLDHLVDFG